MTPTFRGKRGRGHNLGIIHISYIGSYHSFTVISTPCRLYSGMWALCCGASRRQLFCDWRPIDSEITTILPVRGKQDYLLRQI